MKNRALKVGDKVKIRRPSKLFKGRYLRMVGEVVEIIYGSRYPLVVKFGHDYESFRDEELELLDQIKSR